jgi:hypothetical protein
MHGGGDYLRTFAGLAGTTLQLTPVPIFGIAFLFGASRAFLSPAGVAMGPMLVPREALPRAISRNSLGDQAGSVIGSWIGGVLFAVSPAVAYAGSAVLYAVAGVAAFGVSTLVFAVSKSLIVSVIALAVADMISVYVRQSLIQIVTPDSIRGDLRRSGLAAGHWRPVSDVPVPAQSGSAGRDGGSTVGPHCVIRFLPAV